MNLSILSIAEGLHNYINTYSVMGTMINNVRDTGVRLRKESIQSMKGGDSGVTRMVDTVHYSAVDRLFVLEVGTGQRNPHRIYVWTEHCQMSRSPLGKLSWRWAHSTHEKLCVSRWTNGSVFLKVKVKERAACKMRPDHAEARDVDNEEPLNSFKQEIDWNKYSLFHD